MNDCRIIEKKPSDWWQSLLAVLFECCVFFALGYFGRPVIERWFS